MLFNLNNNVPLIQFATYALLIINLPVWIYIARIHKFDRDLVAPIILVILHALVFYTCIIFFNWSFFSFTGWSQWLRFHTWASAAMIGLALIIRKKKVDKAHVG